MDEYNLFTLFEFALAAQINQASGALTGINRVKEDAFELREHLNGRDAAWRWNAVTVADVVGVGDHVCARDNAWTAQFFSGRQRQVEDVLLLICDRLSFLWLWTT